jgi:hypothetical protein
MKDLQGPDLAPYRKVHSKLGYGDKEGGYFSIQSPLQKDRWLRILASTGMGWDHVSVSLPHRIPTWTEMDFVKRRFFNDDEVVMQIHPATPDHINNFPYCLHLWRPQNEMIPVPPMECV